LQVSKEIDNTAESDTAKLDQLFKEMEGLSRRVAERSTVRENIIREAWNRLKR